MAMAALRAAREDQRGSRPDGPGEIASYRWLAAFTQPAGVVMLSAEDDPADTIRPRLEAVAPISTASRSLRRDARRRRLAAMCDELGDVKLITVDPIQAYLPASVNAGRDRTSGWRSSRCASSPPTANRRRARPASEPPPDGDPLARIADSQGVPQLARSVMIWGPDPSDPEGDHGTRKALTRVKGNLARSSTASATFTITEKRGRRRDPSAASCPWRRRGDHSRRRDRRP